MEAYWLQVQDQERDKQPAGHYTQERPPGYAGYVSHLRDQGFPHR